MEPDEDPKHRIDPASKEMRMDASEEWGELDTKIVDALNTLPVPVHVASRIVEHLENAVDIEAGQPAQKLGLGAHLASRRTLYAASLAVGAIVLLAVGLMYFGRVQDPDQLVAYCLEQLDRASVEETTWDSNPASPEVSRFVQQHLSLQQVTSVRSQLVSAGEWGTSCQLWEITEARGTLYVFVFPDAHRVQHLGNQLGILQSSGNWSVAATQSNGQVVLLISQGDVRQFFRTGFA